MRYARKEEGQERRSKKTGNGDVYSDNVNLLVIAIFGQYLNNVYTWYAMHIIRLVCFTLFFLFFNFTIATAKHRQQQQTTYRKCYAFTRKRVFVFWCRDRNGFILFDLYLLGLFVFDFNCVYRVFRIKSISLEKHAFAYQSKHH